LSRVRPEPPWTVYLLDGIDIYLLDGIDIIYVDGESSGGDHS